MKHIHQWTFELVSESPLRIGDNDTELLLDMEGKPFLPSTSWAGACRAYVEQTYGSSTAGRLFGNTGHIRQPSRLIVSDGVCTTVQPFDVRTGIAINGQTKTVEDKALFSKVTVSSGVVFEVALLLKTCSKDQEEDKEIVEVFLAALNSGAIRLGAYKSTGGGKFTIRNGKYVYYDCTKEKDVLAYVHQNKELENWLPREEQSHRSLVQITITGQTASPLLIAGQYPNDSKEPDRTYIRMLHNGISIPIIPGTSFKGVLRHRVERIANVLRLNKKEEYFIRLFGTERKIKQKQREEKSPNSQIMDEIGCKAKQSGRLFLEDIILVQDKPRNRTKTYYRIGIDPITGGVKEGALMNEETILGSFTTTLTYHLKEEKKRTLEEKNKDSVSIALLLFALRDFAQQWMTVGSGAAIGRGYLDVASIIVQDKQRMIHFDFKKKQIVDETKWLEKLQDALNREKN